MKLLSKRWLTAALVLACGASAACDNGTTGPGANTALYVVAADGNFRSIGAALKAAPAGEVIEVRGAFSERVVIDKPGIKLRGVGAVLDGAGVDGGRGIGIHITNVSDVEVSGFTVRNFERGIVVQGSANAIIRRNEVHTNNSKTASSATTLTPGVDLFEGLVLLGSTGTQVTDNVLRNNGHDGLMITGGSRNNVVRANKIMDNGAQTLQIVPGQFG